MANLGTVTRGDTEVINLTIKNADGTARNITTDTLKFTIKISPYSATYVVQKLSTGGTPGIVKTTPASGLADVTLLPADLQSLAKEYVLYADLEVTDSAGRVATTPYTLNFILDITTP